MRYEIQEWSQDKGVYEGKHDISEVVAYVTVEDLLHAMYTVNIELTDENLDRILHELDWYLLGLDFYDDIERFVDEAIRRASWTS